MEDILISNREYFNKLLDYYDNLECCKEERKEELIFFAEDIELTYRSGLTRGKIIGLGLKDYMEEIIDGMNRSFNRVLPSDLAIFDSPKHHLEIIRASSDSLLTFALDYVDKWVMYKNLFK